MAKTETKTEAKTEAKTANSLPDSSTVIKQAIVYRDAQIVLATERMDTHQQAMTALLGKIDEEKQLIRKLETEAASLMSSTTSKPSASRGRGRAHGNVKYNEGMHKFRCPNCLDYRTSRADFEVADCIA